jgi:hypothetical protein
LANCQAPMATGSNKSVSAGAVSVIFRLRKFQIGE